ncbi:MAG: ATP-grasp domain-containing protein [Methylotenera sp.]|nr:ATP-grasp domain-containing protein [Oligoflexia bacterium]
MRVGLAEDTVLPQAKALVLGQQNVAEIIAEEFESLGMEARLLPSDVPLPSPTDPNGADELKKILLNFLATAGSAPRGSHCVHPGVSPWADRAEFALIAQDVGLNPICPPPKILSLFANKLNLLTEADALGIPHLVLSFDPIQSLREIEALIGMSGGKSKAKSKPPAIGSPKSSDPAKGGPSKSDSADAERETQKKFPFILKSIRGGGSVGCMVVHAAEDLERRVPTWIEQLRRSQGQAILFAEKYVSSSRHIVVPFAAMRSGEVTLFPMVDASLQCRFRKVMQFCPATGMDAAVQTQIGEWTTRLARKTGFVGVGALEFLVDGPRAFLIEGIARLNTEFSIWERVAGTQAVAWQLAAIRGNQSHPKPALGSTDPEWRFGIALRFYAEDPVFQLPQPGMVRETSPRREWSFPGARAFLKLSIESGHEVPSQGTGILGELYVGAQDRKQALTVARGVLDELWIAGSLHTNERYLAELLSHPWIREDMFYAGFLDEEFIPELRPVEGMLKLFTSITAALFETEKSKWVAGDQWVIPNPSSVKWVGEPEKWGTTLLPGASGVVELEEGPKARFCAFPLAYGRWQVRLGSWTMHVRRISAKPVNNVIPALGGALGNQIQPKPGEKKLFSLTRGRVHSILYRESTLIPAHEPLLMVESLGMLVPHALPVDVRISRILVSANDSVSTGQELALFTVEQA